MSAISDDKAIDDLAIFSINRLLESCDGLAHGPEGGRSLFLEKIKATLKVSLVVDEDGNSEDQVTQSPDFDINECGDKNLRAVDILCRGKDSDEACFALLYLMQAGADLSEQPSPSECSPLHASAYNANSKIANTLIALGVDEKSLSNGSKQSLLGSNAIHALATGFRDNRAQEYAETFSVLLAAGCDIDARDRKRQAPIDIAMKSAASTGVKSLVDAMLQYGVKIESNGQSHASKIANALVKRTGDFEMLSKLSGSAISSMLRSSAALKSVEAAAESEISNSISNLAPSP